MIFYTRYLFDRISIRLDRFSRTDGPLNLCVSLEQQNIIKVNLFKKKKIIDITKPHQLNPLFNRCDIINNPQAMFPII